MSDKCMMNSERSLLVTSKVKQWLHCPASKTRPFLLSAVVISLSKFWLGSLNKATAFNLDQFIHLVENRPDKQGLVTVSNHYSYLDDPLMWGVVPLKKMLKDRRYWRWIPSAEEICFSNPITATIFSLGRCIPVRRGNGVYQKGMDFCLDQLNQGDWVHVFPEGKLNMEHDYMRIKWGVGRLISECSVPPIVLPVFHIGIDSILPNRAPYIPRIRKDVTVVFGEPIDYSDVLARLKSQRKNPTEIRKYITDDIQETLFKLRVKAEYIHNHRLGKDV